MFDLLNWIDRFLMFMWIGDRMSLLMPPRYAGSISHVRSVKVVERGWNAFYVFINLP